MTESPTKGPDYRNVPGSQQPEALTELGLFLAQVDGVTITSTPNDLPLSFQLQELVPVVITLTEQPEGHFFCNIRYGFFITSQEGVSENGKDVLATALTNLADKLPADHGTLATTLRTAAENLKEEDDG